MSRHSTQNLNRNRASEKIKELLPRPHFLILRSRVLLKGILTKPTGSETVMDQGHLKAMKDFFDYVDDKLVLTLFPALLFKAPSSLFHAHSSLFPPFLLPGGS